MKQSDDGLLQQLDEVRERVRAYEAPPEVVELPKGVVRLGKKTDDGRVVPVRHGRQSARAASVLT
jgi:hypothetical protein